VTWALSVTISHMAFSEKKREKKDFIDVTGRVAFVVIALALLGVLQQRWW